MGGLYSLLENSTFDTFKEGTQFMTPTRMLKDELYPFLGKQPVMTSKNFNKGGCRCNHTHIPAVA